MNFNDAMNYLEDLKSLGFILGLDNIKKLMEALGRPDKKLKFIHVAGTNGKGSTSTYIANVLKEAGYMTGLYTSPSILRFNERFVIDGVEIDSEKIAALLEKIKITSEENEIQITAFEAETALAILYFADEGCDFAVLEVGMGGRLDATNFIDSAEVTVITNIGIDHIDFLGSSLTEIAHEKAGVIKGGMVVSYKQDEEVKAVLDEAAVEKGATIDYLNLDEVAVKEVSEKGQLLDFHEFEDIRISLIGDYQPYNAGLALMAIRKLRELGYIIEDSAVKAGMKAAIILGRFQLVNEEPVIIVDGAHNVQGVESLVSTLKKLYGDKKHIFIFGTLRDKDYITSIKMTLPIAKLYFTTRPDSDRALSSIDLKNEIIMNGGAAIAIGSTTAALNAAIKNAEEDDTIICFGSLYQVGEVLEYFKEN